MNLGHDLVALAPLAGLALAAAAVLLLAVAGGPAAAEPRGAVPLVALALVALAYAGWGLAQPAAAPLFYGAICLDGLTAAFAVTVCAGAAGALVLALPSLRRQALPVGEFVALVLLASLGMGMLVAAGDLWVMFVGLETMSLAAYVITGLPRAARRSQEAALKYFIYGAFASGFVLFGLALIYGEVGRATGVPSLGLVAVREALGQGALGPLAWAGVALVLAGLAFKVAAVPFHMWAPDVYEGAPTAAAAFMAVGIKAAAVAALCRFVLAAAPPGARLHGAVSQFLQTLAVASMLGGNLLALRQRQLKRLLAYSSVAHAGYALMAVVALVEQPEGPALMALNMYLLAYTAMTLGAFGVLIAVEGPEVGPHGLDLDRLVGLGRRRPGPALALIVSLLSLAGLPPTVGFLGKLGLIQAVLAAGRPGLAAWAMVASAVGVAAYLRMLAWATMRPPLAHVTPPTDLSSPWLTAGLSCCVATTLGLGLWPGPYWAFLQRLVGAGAG